MISSILNVGCGNRERGFGIDITRASKARIIADVHNLPFRNKSFKATICTEVLEHLQNPLRALKEIKRVSSWIYVTVPNIYYFGRVLRFILRKPASITLDHKYAFPLEELKILLETAGYKISFWDYIKGDYHKRQLPTLLFRHCLRIVAHAS